MIAHFPPICPYCMTPAHLVDSTEVYGRDYGHSVWICGNYPTCDAYVGCHKGTTDPKGRLADADLRRAKVEAHKALDPLWRDAPKIYGISRGPYNRHSVKRIQRKMRQRVYQWLAEQLGLPEPEAHIGWMDEDTCHRVILVASQARTSEIRQWAKQREAEHEGA